MSNLFKSLAIIQIKNIIHRDLKPQHLLFRLLDRDYNICLVDFGLSEYYDQLD